MNAPNPWADSARLKKRDKLVAQIEREAQVAGLNLRDDAALILERVRGLTVKTWVQLSLAAGCNPPSPDTIDLVVAHFASRVQ